MKNLKLQGLPERTIIGFAVVSLLFLIGSGFTGCKMATEMPEPPVAEKIPKELTIHGDTRVDEYYWLRERENPKVIAYLTAENEYKDAVLKHTESFQKELYDEIVGRIKKTDMSVPSKESGYYYYSRYEEGGEYPIYCRKKGTMEAEEEILLNVNEMAKGHNYYSVAGYSVSTNNNLIAFGVDTVSRRKYTIHFKNLKTGEILPDKIPITSGRAAWANDNKTVFYTIKDEETLRSYKIMRHVLGTDLSSDKEIYDEKDVTFSTYVYKTKSKKYLFIGSGSTLSSEYRFLDADKPDGKFKAKNFRLMATPVIRTTKGNWKEVIPHRDDVLLGGFEIFKDFLVVNERKNGLPNIRIMRWDKKGEHYIDFGEETYSAGISYNPEFDTDVLRYRYSSMTTPSSVFDYNMNTKEKTLLKQQEVIGDFDSNNYHTERLYATARDGTKVPISLVYRKGLEKNGDNPLLLYGYGSYGASMSASFSSVRLSLLDRGFVYAVAHIRGGQEMGRYWYEDGKLLKKKNTFTDFIDCAEHLIAEKFTNPDKLFAQGGSAGGLLMGAVLNMRPDLFKGVVAAVPWVDVITTMLDPDIPLTTSEYDEWGDPNKKEYYDYMLSYSPYDNVAAKDYPAMLVTTGLHDSQVQYFEPAKWVAKIRALKTDNNILLLDTDMESGHGGASGRFRRYKRTALQFAFFLDQIGIKK
jgi:oligopeptidase B